MLTHSTIVSLSPQTHALISHSPSLTPTLTTHTLALTITHAHVQCTLSLTPTFTLSHIKTTHSHLTAPDQPHKLSHPYPTCSVPHMHELTLHSYTSNCTQRQYLSPHLHPLIAYPTHTHTLTSTTFTLCTTKPL